MSNSPRNGLVLKGWRLERRIGRGGNGQVWRARGEGGTEAALKILIKMKPVAYARFRDEVEALTRNADIPGVLPLLDRSVPETLAAGEHAWFAMPLARPLASDADDRKLGVVRRIALIVDIAETLVILHARRIAHRDLKPPNMLMYEGRAHLCDFGLVHYPGKSDLAGVRETLGPRWTLAPELRRHHGDVDPFPTDVYALAKSLWMLATRQSDGFEGQYSSHGTLGLANYGRSSEDMEDRYVAWDGLDRLLTDATEHMPSRRPSMKEFHRRLRSWLRIAQSWDLSSAHNWRALQRQLFPHGVPRVATWKGARDIASVLNLLGATDSMNHMFLPDGGGLDLEGAIPSEREPGCIELLPGEDPYLVMPKHLVFTSFGRDSEWDFFRLETKPLASSKVNPGVRTREEVVDIPGHGYADRTHYDNGEFEGRPLPEGSRLVVRYLRGPFVLFQKSSTYNELRTSDFDAYDALHATMPARDFRALIRELANRAAQKKRTAEGRTR